VVRDRCAMLDTSLAVSSGFANSVDFYSVPFGNVAPPSANLTLGNFDPFNGGFFGHLLNWGARACGIGVSHAFTEYLKSGCWQIRKYYVARCVIGFMRYGL